MTLILIEKGLVSEGSTPKIEDKQVPGIYNYIYIYIFVTGHFQLMCLQIYANIPSSCC